MLAGDLAVPGETFRRLVRRAVEHQPIDDAAVLVDERVGQRVPRRFGGERG